MDQATIIRYVKLIQIVIPGNKSGQLSEILDSAQTADSFIRTINTGDRCRFGQADLPVTIRIEIIYAICLESSIRERDVLRKRPVVQTLKRMPASVPPHSTPKIDHASAGWLGRRVTRQNGV